MDNCNFERQDQYKISQSLREPWGNSSQMWKTFKLGFKSMSPPINIKSGRGLRRTVGVLSVRNFLAPSLPPPNSCKRFFGVHIECCSYSYDETSPLPIPHVFLIMSTEKDCYTLLLSVVVQSTFFTRLNASVPTGGLAAFTQGCCFMTGARIRVK